MERESQEFYSGGEDVSVGTYRDLSTGELVRIYSDGEKLPEPDEGVATYEWISGDPDWTPD